jgi:hypothetical protein
MEIRRIRLLVTIAVPLIGSLLVSSCSKETSCGANAFGGGIKCTESTGPSEEISNFVGRFWFLIVLGGLLAGAAAWAAFDDYAKGKKQAPKTTPQHNTSNSKATSNSNGSPLKETNKTPTHASDESMKRRPSTVAIADLQPGDLVADPTGQAIQVREIMWVSETHIKLIYANGFMDVLAANRTLTKLPPPLR